MTERVRQVDPDRSIVDRLEAILRDRLGTIVGVVLLVVAGLVLVGIDLSIPRMVRLIAVAAIPGIIAGWLASQKIIELFPETPSVWLVDLDAEARGSAGLYRIPVDQWETELTVTDENGQPDGTYDVADLGPRLKVGRRVDLDELEVVGTWRGTLSDDELLRSIDAIRECRGQLQDRAKRGERIANQAWSIVRSATQAEVSQIVETFERGTLPDEDALTEAVDEALDEYGVQDPLDEAAEQFQDLEELADDREASDDEGVDGVDTISPEADGLQEVEADD